MDISWNQKLEKCGKKEEKEVGLGPGAEPEAVAPAPAPAPAPAARRVRARGLAARLCFGTDGRAERVADAPPRPGGRAAAPGADHGLSPGVSFASLHLLRHSLISSKLSKLLA